MFHYKVRLFKVFGITLSADWTSFALAFLITWSLASGLLPQSLPFQPLWLYWALGLLGALGVFMSIVIHEFCHALVGRHYRLPMNEITLFLFGGVAHMEDEPPTPQTEFFMASAGPLASLVLAGIFYSTYGLAETWLANEWLTMILAYLASINLIVALFNLIPAYPLDGGRVLRSLIWGYKKDLRLATRVSARIGQGFGYLLVFLGIAQIVYGFLFNGLWFVFLGLLLNQVAKASVWQMEIKQAFRGRKVLTFLNPRPIVVSADQTFANFMKQHLYQDPQLIYPLMAQDRLVGCLDIRHTEHIPEDEWPDTPLSKLSHECPSKLLIEPQESAMKALQRMSKDNLGELLVVDKSGRLLGTLSLQTLLKYLQMQGTHLPQEQMTRIGAST